MIIVDTFRVRLFSFQGINTIFNLFRIFLTVIYFGLVIFSLYLIAKYKLTWSSVVFIIMISTLWFSLISIELNLILVVFGIVIPSLCFSIIYFLKYLNLRFSNQETLVEFDYEQIKQALLKISLEDPSMEQLAKIIEKFELISLEGQDKYGKMALKIKELLEKLLFSLSSVEKEISTSNRQDRLEIETLKKELASWREGYSSSIVRKFFVQLLGVYNKLIDESKEIEIKNKIVKYFQNFLSNFGLEITNYVEGDDFDSEKMEKRGTHLSEDENLNGKIYKVLWQGLFSTDSSVAKIYDKAQVTIYTYKEEIKNG